jgi:carboxypeptidase Taq
MHASPAELWERVQGEIHQASLLASVESLLSWDEQTKMPPANGEYRAEQVSYLSGLIHERWTQPTLGAWLGELSAIDQRDDAAGAIRANVRELKRRYDLRVKVPKALVEELAKTAILAQQAWVEARKAKKFDGFAPWLTRMIELKREEASALATGTCLYDALLDQYEPGETSANVGRVLRDLRQELVPLVEAIVGSGRHPSRELLSREFAIDGQRTLAEQAVSVMGFEFSRGRLDVAPHPFCSTIGPHDCRLTTRYGTHDLGGAFFSTLHEAGHGMYEQGLPPAAFGLPLGEAISLGIHESQSRMWENLVGRSRGFWQWMLPRAKQQFPVVLDGATLEEMYFAVNDVRPSLIRTESDEATYNLHILVRYELESELIDNRLQVADLPAAWNEKYRQYVGVVADDAADGVLQDIHWSAGLVGYFPTYTLGNLYAAQFFAQAEKDLGPLEPRFAQGEFKPLLEWLRSNIHQYGQRYRAGELVERVTGGPLSHQPLMKYLRGKLGPLYGV